jgi:hypothetical protein
MQVLTPNLVCPALLARAQQLGYSSQGEMFSALNLAKLANDELGNFIKAEVYEGDWDAALLVRLLEHLRNGWPVMFAYDVAKNHEPSLQGGASAHWAAMKGFLVAAPDSFPCPSPAATNLFPYEGGSFWYLNTPNRDPIDLLTAVDTAKLWIVCQHAKSKHQFLWSFDNIKDSNYNLLNCDTSKLEKDGITTNPSLHELRKHLVFIYPSST